MTKEIKSDLLYTNKIKHVLTEIEKKAIYQFASAHYESAMAYQLFNNESALLPMLEPDGAWRNYKVFSLNATSNPHFAGFVLIPHEHINPIIKVIFQGTILSFDRNGIGHLNLNLESRATAADFWKKEGNSIIEQFKNLVDAHYPKDMPLNVYVSGHSRGAGLTQYFTSQFIEYIDKNRISRFESLHNAIFNNTGPTREIIERFNVAFKNIKARLGDSFKFYVNVGHTEGDPIQQTGEGTIYDDLTSDQAFIQMFKIDKSLKKYWSKDLYFENGLQLYEVGKALINGIKSALIAHTHDGYFAPQSEFGSIEIKYPYLYDNNLTSAGDKRIKDELKYKSLITQKLLEPFKFLLHFTLDFFKAHSTSESNPTISIPINLKTEFEEIHHHTKENKFNLSPAYIKQFEKVKFMKESGETLYSHNQSIERLDVLNALYKLTFRK